MIKKLLLVTALSGFAATVGVAQVSYDFNDNTQYTTTNWSNANATNAYTWQATGGLSDTGRVNAATTNVPTSVEQITAFDFSDPGAQLTVSSYFLLGSTPSTGQQATLELGFGASQATQIGNTDTFMFARVASTASDFNSFQFQLRGGNGSSGTRDNSLIGPAFALTNDSWYLLTLTFVNNGSSAPVSVSGSLFNSSNTGVVGSSVSGFGPVSYSNSAANGLRTDSSVYSGFRFAEAGGTEAVDNFTAVPEPATAVLTMSGLGTLLLLRRRR